MADLTARELLEQVIATSQPSTVVVAYAVRTLTTEVLSVRVFLADESFGGW